MGFGFAKNSPVSPRFRAGELSIFNRLFNPVRFKRPEAGDSQSTTNRYETTLLVDICGAIIDANRAGEFDDSNIMKNADVILRAVAKV